MLKALGDYGIGMTPLSHVCDISGNAVYLKLEKENFLDSVKARTAYGIVRGLKENDKTPLVESTSGNLGIALDFFCREEGRRLLCLIDPSISQDKMEKLRQLCIDYEMMSEDSGPDYRSARIQRAAQLERQGKFHWVNQYDNEDGILSHYRTTGPEIWEQTGGEITHLVCPVGSGGTIVGTGRYLKEMNQAIRIIAVEPAGSTIYSNHEGTYLNVGAGLKGKPGNIVRNPNIVDEAYAVMDQESIDMSNELYYRYGYDVGVSSGMAYAAALRVIKGGSRWKVVVLAPDGRKSYSRILF